MNIEQLRVGMDNFSYIIICEKTRKAAIVDPGYDATQVLEILSDKHLELQYIILTHYHRDHTSDYQKMKQLYPSVKGVASTQDIPHLGFKVDIQVLDQDQIQLGNVPLKFIVTPGHTPGGICIIADNKALFTGDTLFIGDCGRVDLPGGDLNQMYHSLHDTLMSLPNELIVYPGHDYGDKSFDSLRNQKQYFSSYFKNVIHLIKIH